MAKDPDAPSFMEKQRAAHPGLDHLMRAVERFTKQNGDFYAGGITYYSVLSIFPVLMVGFAIVGLVLTGNDDLILRVQDSITDSLPAEFAGLLSPLIDQAIEQPGAVGIIGLLVATYSGLGWMGNLRTGLTAQWEQEPVKKNFVVTKVLDLLALLGLFGALAASLAISAVGGSGITTSILRALRLDDVTGAGVVVWLVSLAVSVVASWLVFIWVIAYLPRERADVRSAVWAALFAALAFEVFKQFATVYLKSVMSSPAGATFGPIIGIMVFLFFTWRILLFFTAFAATTKDSMAKASVPVPEPVVISPRVEVREAPSGKVAGALVVAGALLGLGAARVTGRREPRD